MSRFNASFYFPSLPNGAFDIWDSTAKDMRYNVPTATTIVVDSSLEANLPHIAYEYLGDTSLWWTLLYFNGLTDPLSDIYSLAVLRIPERQALITYLERTITGRSNREFTVDQIAAEHMPSPWPFYKSSPCAVDVAPTPETGRFRMWFSVAVDAGSGWVFDGLLPLNCSSTVPQYSGSLTLHIQNVNVFGQDNDFVINNTPLFSQETSIRDVLPSFIVVPDESNWLLDFTANNIQPGGYESIQHLGGIFSFHVTGPGLFKVVVPDGVMVTPEGHSSFYWEDNPSTNPLITCAGPT